MKKIALASLLAIGLAASPALAKSGTKVGMLTCVVAGGVGLFVGSSKKIACTFDPSNGGKDERYVGTIGKLGIDVGITGRTKIAWVVFAPGKVNKGALAGHYAGATAEATVAVGLGANALVGGSNKTIALQPFSVQAQTGLNVAAGIASLRLERAK